MKPIMYAILCIIFLFSCKSADSKITNAKDYEKYLVLADNKEVDFAKNEISFWRKKLDAAPNQLSYLLKLSSNHSKLFELTGDVDYLHKAENNLLEYIKAYHYMDVNPMRSLARNFISQHRFLEALSLAEKSFKIAEGMAETQKLLFDVHMELGNYTEAEKSLQYLSKENDFDYKIRKAKWLDHHGDLTTAIAYMEEAKVLAEKSNNEYLKTWIYSNIADMYGHEGNIQAAYHYYLETLALNPNHSYSLKGIAWIAFSYQKDVIESLRIIDKIAQKHNTPDYLLLKSQIAQYANDHKKESDYLIQYFAKQNSSDYGTMYNKYNMLIYADDAKNKQKALEIAKIEVAHRPTPDSYDLLSWAYYNIGDIDKSLEIQNEYVIGKSFEPSAKYHLAMIYKANKNDNLIIPLKVELEKSCFELGPNIEKNIKTL